MDSSTDSNLPTDPDGPDDVDQDSVPAVGTSLARFIPSLVALGVGVVAALMSWQLGVGSLAVPGAGFWPLMISIALAVLAAISLLVEDRSEPDLDRSPVVPVVVGVGSLALFIVGFTHTGLVLPTFAVLVVWLRFLAHESRRSTVVIAGTATAALWLVFGVFLDVPFPLGPYQL